MDGEFYERLYLYSPSVYFAGQYSILKTLNGGKSNFQEIFFFSLSHPKAVLRHFILMRILDTHWKKMDPDPDHENFYKNFRFFNKKNVQIQFLFFRFFYAKTG